jgi:hypothetical protein
MIRAKKLQILSNLRRNYSSFYKLNEVFDRRNEMLQKNLEVKVLNVIKVEKFVK